MNQYNDGCGEWWTGDIENCNIYSALSNNLQKYESIYRTENRLLKLKLPRKKSDTIHQHRELREIPALNPTLTPQEPPLLTLPALAVCHQRLNTADPCPAYDAKHEQLAQRQCQNVNMLNRRSRQKELKVRYGGVRSQSSHQSREQRCAVPMREIKFVKRDKKKFKDRCVQLYAESKSKAKISLVEIDSINKQCREEKIDLFLKLLRR